jgi:uridine kinase
MTNTQNDIQTYIKSSNYKLIGITGNAGGGKSTLAMKFAEDPSYVHYSADYKFIGDSLFRKELLNKKSKNIDSYIDACNQYNWWDWDSIEKDLDDLKNNREVILSTKYNRDTSFMESGVSYRPTTETKIIYEGALLGTPKILNSLDKIIFIHTPSIIRFNRLVEKDIKKRTLNEIAARFLITEYSENKHYNHLFEFYKNKIIVINDNYNFISFNQNILKEKQFIPYPI